MGGGGGGGGGGWDASAKHEKKLSLVCHRGGRMFVVL